MPTRASWRRRVGAVVGAAVLGGLATVTLVTPAGAAAPAPVPPAAGAAVGTRATAPKATPHRAAVPGRAATACADTVPGAPRNVTIQLTGPGDVVVEWQPPEDADCHPILRYSVWFWDYSDPGWQCGCIAPLLRFGVGGLPSGHTFLFAIGAQNEFGWSTDFGYATITIP